MKTFLSDKNNDLLLNAGGNLELIAGTEAIATTARQAMQTRRGEMIHDTQGGIPFDDAVWQGAPNIAAFEAASRRRLLNVPGVVSITEFTAELIEDTLQYTATLKTNAGEVTVNG